MGFWAKQALLVLSATIKWPYRAGEWWGVVARWVPTLAPVAIAYFIQRHIPGVQNLYDWGFPTMIAIVVVAVSVFIAAVQLQGRLTQRGEWVAGQRLLFAGERL